jgi:hypothetical protein
MVKNVPFEAPAKELRELFGTYGQVYHRLNHAPLVSSYDITMVVLVLL